MNDGLVKQAGGDNRLTDEQWSGHVAAWCRSGWSMARYCRERGLVLHQFSYRVHAGGGKSAGGFVEVRAVDHGGSDLVLEWGGRGRIRIPRGFDPGTLARVLELTR